MQNYQTEFTFTMGSDALDYEEWNDLAQDIGAAVSRDFGGCRFVWGNGAWREGADVDAATFNGKLHEDRTLSLIVAVPAQSADPAFGLIQSAIAAAVRFHDLSDRLDWIDTTQRDVIARHWQASKFFNQAA